MSDKQSLNKNYLQHYIKNIGQLVLSKKVVLCRKVAKYKIWHLQRMIKAKYLYLAYIIYPTSVYKPALRFLIFNVIYNYKK